MGNPATSGNVPPTGHPGRLCGRRRPHQAPGAAGPAARTPRPAQLPSDPLRHRPQQPRPRAHELGVSEWTITQALATLGVVLPPRPERLAVQRRRYAEERIGARVVELGFAEIRAYLEDRLIEREWLLVEVAGELAADRRTVRRLMQQLGVTRGRRTAR